jgi:hypothetical protein
MSSALPGAVDASGAVDDSEALACLSACAALVQSQLAAREAARHCGGHQLPEARVDAAVLDAVHGELVKESLPIVHLRQPQRCQLAHQSWGAER